MGGVVALSAAVDVRPGALVGPQDETPRLDQERLLVAYGRVWSKTVNW